VKFRDVYGIKKYLPVLDLQRSWILWQSPWWIIVFRNKGYITIASHHLYYL